MDQTVKTITSEGADARKWIGRIIMAVILGEAIWSLIVSIMNNLVVPWLGDMMGQASGLPTSFTQRPYDYPDLFVSVLEFCIAGIVAVMLNYFLQRQRAGSVKPVKSSAATAPVEPARVVPQATAAAATTPVCTQHARWAKAKAALVLDDLRSTTREYEQHQKQASPMLKSAGCRSRSRVWHNRPSD